LAFDYNQLTGNIPSELGQLSNLSKLYLQNNQLSGSIPSELGNLSNLDDLWLSNNQLTGTIPAEIGNLTNLQYSHLDHNELSGSIPIEFGSLTNIQQLYLSNNKFNGITDLSSMTNLSLFYLNNNQFIFEDFENTGLNFSAISEIVYSPQDTLQLNVSVTTINEGEQFILNCQNFTVENLSSSNNLFAVYKEDVLLYDWSADPEYSISTVSSSAAGKYTIRVSNSVYPDLILYTDTLTVEVNHDPTDIVLSSNSIDENQASGLTVGTLTATDQDAGDTHTFALIAGDGSNDADNSSFTIEGNVLKTAEIFDYETQSTYNIYIEVEDAAGATFEKNFLINVVDKNDSPINIALSNSSINENQSIGTIVGVFTTTDQDVSDSHTYILISGNGTNDTDNSSFTIDGTILKTNEVFDFETNQTNNIYVQSIDSKGATYEKAFAININDLTETGINDISESFTVFPNPSNGRFAIEYNSTNYKVKIFDAIGNLIYQKHSQNYKVDVDLGRIVSGICFIVIEGKDSIAYKKIIIQ
jgi:hypothetical protein